MSGFPLAVMVGLVPTIPTSSSGEDSVQDGVSRHKGENEGEVPEHIHLSPS